MLRALVPGLIVLASALAPAAAPTPTAPSTRPGAPRALSSDELHALEREAFDLMKAGKYSKAATALEKVYAAIPPAQRSRALVLNHCIVDVVGKKYAMRGVRDLLEYFQRQTDE